MTTKNSSSSYSVSNGSVPNDSLSPHSLPSNNPLHASGIQESALNSSLEIQLKCAELGFDWPEVTPVFDKVLEELDEIKAEVQAPVHTQEKIEDEIGDLLFAAVNLARHLKVHPEVALQKANEKFTQRFALVERFADSDNLELNKMSLDALEVLWSKAKSTLSDEKK
ncbi:MazG nucleotide pyrophosphohydrolase domain-containing protein [Glaciecola sp. MF2-115]|uniref:MazG nucleotide pyrophosphohydrolase domain-containing protein n=1 Tax=Glaciecola sp. MF2-115 TaxID=3384827 RepID=UPI0039A2A719